MTAVVELAGGSVVRGDARLLDGIDWTLKQPKNLEALLAKRARPKAESAKPQAAEVSADDAARPETATVDALAAPTRRAISRSPCASPSWTLPKLDAILDASLGAMQGVACLSCRLTNSKRRGRPSGAPRTVRR